MKKIAFTLLMVLTTVFSMSFKTYPINMAELLGTKWISPINDNCYDSLCFTSANTVMYYSCEHNTYAEIGYKINGDKIEIEAYSNSSMDPDSKLVVIMDDGILKRALSHNNFFPKNFINVPDGVCN